MLVRVYQEYLNFGQHENYGYKWCKNETNDQKISVSIKGLLVKQKSLLTDVTYMNQIADHLYLSFMLSIFSSWWWFVPEK